jgi:hypothetical protein
VTSIWLQYSYAKYCQTLSLKGNTVSLLIWPPWGAVSPTLVFKYFWLLYSLRTKNILLCGFLRLVCAARGKMLVSVFPSFSLKIAVYSRNESRLKTNLYISNRISCLVLLSSPSWVWLIYEWWVSPFFALWWELSVIIPDWFVKTVKLKLKLDLRKKTCTFFQIIVFIYRVELAIMFRPLEYSTPFSASLTRSGGLLPVLWWRLWGHLSLLITAAQIARLNRFQFN